MRASGAPDDGPWRVDPADSNMTEVRPIRSLGPAAAALLAAVAVAACGPTATPGDATSGATGARATATRSSVAGARTPPAPSTAPQGPATVIVRSPAFDAGTAIPYRFSCWGADTPPPLRWSRVPPATVTIALVMDDPDAVTGTYTHWVVFNLPARAGGVAGPRLPAGAAQARNSGGDAAYLGPCPPSGTHRYRFTVYAERATLPLSDGAPLHDALAAIRTHALASGRLIGIFSHD